MAQTKSQIGNKTYSKQIDKFKGSSMFLYDYCLVDCETLSVFAEVPSTELFRISGISKRVKEFKAFSYYVSGNNYSHGKCLAIRNEVVQMFINPVEVKVHNMLLKKFNAKTSFGTMRNRNMKILLGPAHMDLQILHSVKRIQLSYSVAIKSFQSSALGVNTINRVDNGFDTEILKEYDGLKDLLMKKTVKQTFKMSDSQRASNLILYLQEYLDQDLTRTQALRLIGEEMLVKFEETPKEKKFDFMKEIGKNFFTM